MNQLELNSNWKFKDVKDNIEALVSQFEGILTPFSYTHLKEQNHKLYHLKHQVFDYKNILYWQRERLWEVLNGYFDIEDFKKLQ